MSLAPGPRMQLEVWGVVHALGYKMNNLIESCVISYILNLLNPEWYAVWFSVPSRSPRPNNTEIPMYKCGHGSAVLTLECVTIFLISTS